MNIKTVFMFFMTVAVMLVGCDKRQAVEVMPEVSDDNCRVENIKKIENTATREKFSSLCSRRPVGIQPTEKPLNWLELTDDKKKQ